MGYVLQDKLVVGISSRALFDLSLCHKIFIEQGQDAYRRHQEELIDVPLLPGVAFTFIQKLLELNNLVDVENKLVEVIILSRNDPDTGKRIMRSVKTHKLDISRAIFTEGMSPFPYMSQLNMCLFLSAEIEDVESALELELPAGLVLEGASTESQNDSGLRIAFDFDGVLADLSSQDIYDADGLDAFHAHESQNIDASIAPGPLAPFLTRLNEIQQIETRRKLIDRTYIPRVRVSVVTARSAPSHERALNSLKSWGVTVNDAFFLGGIDKHKILSVLKPDIFFDDQYAHLAESRNIVPSVHIPLGQIRARSKSPETGNQSPEGEV